MKIANLHKVKGLEAPIVILTKYGRNRGDRSSILVDYSLDTPKAYPFKISVKNGKGSDVDYNFSELTEKKEESKKQYQDELLRLMYVAATRAMNVLIVADDWKFKLGSEKTDKTVIPENSIDKLYSRFELLEFVGSVKQ